MAIFGWLVLVLLAVHGTAAVGAGLLLGGLDLGPAPWYVWVIALPLTVAVWWLLITNAPFTIVT